MSKITSFVRHVVVDYDAWRQHYDAFQDTEEAGDIKSGKVFRSVDDPNDVTVVHEFDDITKAKGLMASAELRSRMTEAGVQGEPLIWFTEED